ncbi:MAG TPA: alpha/beta family hydrolase [Rhodanobacteraceae bacterium]|nr:alpha/beta family hydrolase [Rhodanobacteraceae bacterium]
MRGTLILSHGFESGPDASKTVAMAAAAERRGWRCLRPDFRDLDRAGLAAAVAPRRQRLRQLAAGVDGPLLLAGSSMGAFVSALVSCEVSCVGLFLLALPPGIPGCAQPFDAAAEVPLTLVHGFDDELCPLELVLACARQRQARLLLVPDGHRLAAHVDWVADQFGLFLDQLDGERV